MQVTKFSFLILFVFSLVLETPCTDGSTFGRKLVKKPEGTVKTLKADNGDIIDCVPLYKQPAFSHPLLNNHTLQEPSSHKSGVKENNEVLDYVFDISWRRNGGCPDGSVPIIRHILSYQHALTKNVTLSYAARDEQTNVNAGAYFQPGGATIIGGRGTFNIWNPHVVRNSDFSLAQIWIVAGSQPVQTIEVGWQVFPDRTQYAGPVLFVYWTNKGHQDGSGCYDTTCPGFVQYSTQYAPGMHLQASVYGGKQTELAVDIEKDQGSGNWWLYLAGTPVGYWPSSIYNDGPMTQAANNIAWGGEIHDSSGTSGYHTLTQMGSGHFPSEGYGKACYVRDLIYTDTSGNAIAITEDKLVGTQPAPNCYKYEFQQQNSQLYTFVGGPGCN